MILLSHMRIALIILLITFTVPLGVDVCATCEDSLSQSLVANLERSSLQNDTSRPEISDWNITDEAFLGEAFEAWAEVFDSGSGVLNVSLVIENETHIVREKLLPFNGSHFSDQISALALNDTYDLFIRAFDNANNTAMSFRIEVDLRIVPGSDIDEWITMPVVVASSLAVMLVVILAARIMQKRKE